MPAHAEKTARRASSLALDVAQGPSTEAPDLESPTHDEESMGNGTAIEAMLDAEPDEDGGGILEAVEAEQMEDTVEHGATEEALAPLWAEPVGEGSREGEEVFDFCGTRVEVGDHVIFSEAVWEVEAIVLGAEPGAFTLELSDLDGVGALNESRDFAVTERDVCPIDEDDWDDAIGMGTAGAPKPGAKGPMDAALTADAAASQFIALDTLHKVKVRGRTDDLYKSRGLVDAADSTGTDLLKRRMLPKFARAKLWSDAEKEFEELSGAEVAKSAPKYRKMMVRAVERLDDYTVQIDTARALAESTYTEVSESWDAAAAAGDEEEKASLGKTLGSIKLLKDEIDMGGPAVQFNADKTHERSQKTVKWSDKVELQASSKAAEALASGSGDDVAADEPTHRAWVQEAMGDRTMGKKIANKAHALSRGIIDETVFGTRSKGRIGRKLKRAKKKGKGVAASAGTKAAALPLSYLTGGLIDAETRDVDGGGTKTGLNFNTWKSNFQRVRAECAEIEASAVYGEHVGLYNGLKMVVDFGLPTLQGVLKALIVWGALLAPVSMGLGLGLSAVAGTVALVVAALKGVLEVVLTLWSAKKVEDYTDRDARKKKLATAERWKHGRGALEDAATFAALSGASTTSSGKQMKPGDSASDRFTDVTNSERRGLGTVSTAGAGKTVGVGEGLDVSTGRMDISTTSSRVAGKLTSKTVDVVGDALDMDGHKAEKDREHRIDPLSSHEAMRDLSEEDAFFSASAGPQAEGVAPLAPGEAPRGPAPAPPGADKAASEGSKAKRLSAKVASGLAAAAGKVTGLPEEAKDKDPDSDQKVADLATIASDAAAVAEVLP